VRLLAPPGVEVRFYRGLPVLPHFNPDLDGERAPPIPAAVLDCGARLVGAMPSSLLARSTRTACPAR
jgi:hypothetical protein